MYYHTIILLNDGVWTTRKKVMFKSDATTTRGICKALAKAVVDQLGTDVFEVADTIMSRRRKDDWPSGRIRLTKADEYYVWQTAHNMLLG